MIKAVFTDIDGTLLRGFITLDFVEFLHKNNLFSAGAYLNQKKLALKYKEGSISFQDWLIEWSKIWGAGIKGQQSKEINESAKLFFELFMPKIYSSSIELVKLFKSKGYLVIGVSAGIIEVQNLVKEYLGFDYVFASESEILNGVYSGRVLTKLHTDKGKKEKLLNFCLEKKIDLSESIGVGDTQHDVQMLELLGKKIVLNPNKELLTVAEDKSYLVADYTNIIQKIRKSF